MTTRIILVERAGDAADAVERVLTASSLTVSVRRAGSRSALLEELEAFRPDLVIAGDPDRGFGGQEALDVVRAYDPELPVIVVTPSCDGRTAVKYVERGAADCVLMEHIARLGSAVLAALQAKRHREEIRRAETARRESEDRYRDIVTQAPIGIYQSTADGEIVMANPALARMLGYANPEELVGKHLGRDIYWREADRADLLARYRSTNGAIEVEVRWKRRDGTAIWVELGFQVVKDDQGRVEYIEGFAQDISERRRAMEARAQLAAILEATPDFVGTADREGRALYINRAGRDMLGIAADAPVEGKPIADFHPAWATDIIVTEGQPTAIRDGVWSGETALCRPDGSEIPVSQVILSHRAPDGELEFFSTVMRDLSDRKHLEEQLLQSQRMEAVGRLAGGVAHDFNNIITAIVGYTDLLLEELAPADPKKDDIEEIRRVADRAAALTQQLLAFSRKQVLQPVVLDMNAVVANMDKMLRRIIGEDIDLRTAFGADLWSVRADPGQIEQVIVNLAVNARDAMPRGGRLTIETANVALDAAYAKEHLGAPPGAYVMLAVSDTGTGIDAAARARIFEPFFTTKGPDKGSGLGLSTVYGIVKQSDGHIWVYSEPGHGATFKIYLPRTALGTAAPGLVPAARSAARGTETVLLVEDAIPVRRLTRKVLEGYGYRVLEAEGPEHALDLCRQHRDSLRLVLTDVVMPEMSGRELAARLAQICPTVKVLYMSGYTEDAVIHHGVPNEAVAYMQKPFTPELLARKIRLLLDS